jgi:hypothetical protein
VGTVLQVVALCIWFLTFGCSGSKVTTQTSNELARYHVRALALAPFSALATPQVVDSSNLFLSSPQSVRRSDISLGTPPVGEPALQQTVTVPSHAAEKITQLFWNRLKGRKQLSMLEPNRTEKALSQIGGDPKMVTPESRASAAAKTLKVDAVLIGQVRIYQERVGSRLGADPPASVGFEVKTVAADGQVLWVGNYYERQKPMIQDFLGFFQHGAGFVTADELAAYGVQQVLKQFPFGIEE